MTYLSLSIVQTDHAANKAFPAHFSNTCVTPANYISH